MQKSDDVEYDVIYRYCLFL